MSKIAPLNFFERQKITSVLLVLLLIAMMVLANYTTASNDDYWHSFYINKSKSSLPSSMTWTYGQYRNWTGRILVSVMQGVSILPPLHAHYISIINFIIFVLCLLFNLKSQNLSTPKNIVQYPQIIGALIIILFPIVYFVLGEAVFWMSSVYVWPLLILLLLKHILLNSLEKFNNKYIYLVYFLALLSGNSIELLIFPNLYIFYIAYQRPENVLFRKVIFKLFFYFLLGVLISILAPGNTQHLASERHLLSLDLHSHAINAYEILSKGISLSSKLFFISVVGIFISSSLNIDPLKNLSRSLKENFILALSSLIFLIPIYGFNFNRTYIYFQFFISFSLFYCGILLGTHFKINFKLSKILSDIILLSFIYIVYLNIVDARKIKLSFENQQSAILKQSKVSKNLLVKKFTQPMDFHLLYYTDLTSDPNSWPNKAQAKYYGVNSIISY